MKTLTNYNHTIYASYLGYISQAVVIHNFQNLRLIQARNRLRSLVVVNKNHTLSARLDQMITGKCADHTLIFVQNRIAAIAALQHALTDIVNIVIQVEALDGIGATDAADGHGLIDHAHRTIRIEGCGNNASIGLDLAQLFAQLCLTDDDAFDADFQRSAHHIGLLTAHYDAVLA